MSSSKTIKLLTILLPIILLGLVACADKYLAKLSVLLPNCYFYAVFRKACPACGNTRSVQALLNGDVLLSLKYNITPIFLLTVSVAFYTELVMYAVTGKHKALVPRNNLFLYGTLCLFLLYYAVRNVVPFLAL